VILKLPGRHLIAVAAVLLAALDLGACGGSGPSGFTARTPPANSSDFSMVLPSPEMADETEDLLTSQAGAKYASPRCEPADSLDGVGEFNFDCTAKDRRRGEWFKLDVVVFGTESGEPELGPVGQLLCNPVNSRGEDLPSCNGGIPVSPDLRAAGRAAATGAAGR
jgi:hypothetical protein